MSWEQLKDILNQNRDYVREEQGPPTVCPIDGELLEINAKGVRMCPMGNYRYP